MSGPYDRTRIADASIRLDSMPNDGRDLKLKVGEDDRKAIADFLNITTVEALDVTLHAVRFRGGMRVTGRLVASIVQPSVVSLEPVRQQIAEPIDRVFLPGGEKSFAEQANAEIFVDPDGEDIPDHFEGNEADLSDLIVETLSLAIDPYPRIGDESVGEVGDARDIEAERPFAALKVLKLPDDKG
ncbi:YceD family protein [Devosia sp.]|uniref:YceD family protein n=1 Tax=Devosia sp. TaxID=1871048 RepID=UPI003BAB0515